MNALFDFRKNQKSIEKPDFSLETEMRDKGLWPVAGVDEAGRGPLAGPVVAAALILDPDRIPEGLDDSKRLSKKSRQEVFHDILHKACAFSVASIPAKVIDQTNILQACLTAMQHAVNALYFCPRFALVDGRDIPSGLPCKARAITGGDRRSFSVAGASIIAKVMRDEMMSSCPQWNELYGFHQHAGYGTLLHKKAIQEFGPVKDFHRMSFRPLADESS